jgi:hypothetical protein
MIQEMSIRTKMDVLQEFGKAQAGIREQHGKLAVHENRMDKTIADSKYWLEKYTNGFKEHDMKMTELSTLLNGRVDNITELMSKRISVEDMKLNFKTLNTMLLVKFRQMEDTKAAVRDVLTF